jgi:hypothetical protein
LHLHPLDPSGLALSATQLRQVLVDDLSQVEQELSQHKSIHIVYPDGQVQVVDELVLPEGQLHKFWPLEKVHEPKLQPHVKEVEPTQPVDVVGHESPLEFLMLLFSVERHPVPK